MKIMTRTAMIVLGYVTFACSSGSSSDNNTPSPWSQIGGSNTTNSAGIYSTYADSNNIPGARNRSTSWIDKQGYLWLFGGYGYDSNRQLGHLNDLWQFNTITAQWIWKSGYNTANNLGVYGTKGNPSSQNNTGARYGALGWVDNSNNLWLFGGYGYATTTSNINYLNDLWQFNPTTALWTWMGGSNSINGNAIFGSKGTSSNSSNNIPGARLGAMNWTDNMGNLWMFGGRGYDETSITSGYLNDLWIYDFRLTPNAWVWVSGSNSINAKANYSPFTGLPSATYILGGRSSPVKWIDSSGNLWLFGGFGVDSNNNQGYLNDLWMCNNPINYSPTTPPSWTWVSGSKIMNKYGVYGTLNIPASKNIPGARYSATSWLGSNGKLWLFGGFGYDAYGALGYLNDLWVFSPTNSLWTWVGGNDTVNSYYGGIPSARNFTSIWLDGQNNVWMFGGYGYSSNGNQGYLNDLWVFKGN